MADNYAGNMLQSRAIYPSTFMPYILLLVGSKFFRSFAIFLSYDILKLIHVVQFLFIVKSGSSLILIFLQKPFSTGKRITKHQWFRISQHAFAGCAIQILWLFGLTLCGPLRTLMLYEHSDIVIIAAISALFTNTSSPSKFRGAVFLLIAVMGLLLFDHDFLRNHMRDHPDIHRDSSILTHLFDHLTDLTGLSDHKGGVILLFCTLCLNVGYNSAAKKLSVDVGGAKRLHALSSVVSTLLLFPWALFVFFTRESRVDSWFFLVFSMFVFIILVFVVDYYIESVCSQRLESLRAARFGAMATFISGLALSCFWNHPLVSRITSVNQLRDVIAEDHMLSGGVVFSFILIMFATYILTSASRGSKGSLIGYSAAGLPLYSFTGDAIQRTSHSIFNVAKSGLKQILEDSNSRKIFYFLCVNLSFTFVELIYGAWTNSLGLISDGFHMLFDCSALVMGLYAAVMSRWPATRIFSYGYDRVEILSGFINGLFLMVIAFFVFSAACTRLVDPPDIKTERLLAVSVAGLLVNLVGIVAFQNSLPHGHSHGHSHGSKSHSHAHGHSHAELDHNTNMQGVFLHVLADTLGSVGVIISTLLIERFGWKVADPICSLFIGTLTFMSVLPLVKETVLILLLRTPVDIQRDLGITLQKLLSLEGVISYRDEHIWRHSSKVVCGTIHVQVKPDSSEQHIITQVSALLKDVGVTNLTVQVEKEAYFLHMSGFGVTIDQVYETTKHVKLLNYENPAANFIKAI